MEFNPDECATAIPRIYEEQIAYLLYDIWGYKYRDVPKLTWEHERDASILLSTRIHDIFQRRIMDIMFEMPPFTNDAENVDEKLQLAHHLKKMADALKMNPVKTRIIQTFKNMWKKGVFR